MNISQNIVNKMKNLEETRRAKNYYIQDRILKNKELQELIIELEHHECE